MALSKEQNIIVESVEITHNSSTQHVFIKMATCPKHEVPAYIATKNMYNSTYNGRDRTPPFLVQSSELIEIKEIVYL